MAIGIYGQPCVSRHSAYIADRGGARRLGQLVDLTSIQWDRRRDETSEAQIIVQGGACAAQAPLLNQIEPRRSEIVIFRDSERVWEGPVNRVGWHANYVEIAAKDVSDYVFGRPLSRAWDNRYRVERDDDGNVIAVLSEPTEVTTRLEQIMAHEMTQPFVYLDDDGVTPISVPAWEAISPPANVLPYFVAHHFPNEVRTAAFTTPFQMTVGEHLDNYARTGGIDYTVIGRALHIWDTSRPLGVGRLLTEADFYGEIVITAYGSDFAAVAFTVANDGSYGGAGAGSDYYGPWAKMFTVYDEDDSQTPTQAELNSQAARNLSGRSPVPIEVRVPDNSSIRLSNGITINTLVPGTHFNLLATLNSRQISQQQKLHKVTVTETAEKEDIQITLVPATRPDDDTVTP